VSKNIYFLIASLTFNRIFKIVAPVEYNATKLSAENVLRYKDMLLNQFPTPNISEELVADVSEIMNSVEMNSTAARQILEAGASVVQLLTQSPNSEQIAEIRREISKVADLVVSAAGFQPGWETLYTDVSFYQDPQNQEISQIAVEEFLKLLEVVDNPVRGYEIINDEAEAERAAENIAKVLNWFKLRSSKSD
jgi:hypothetical protein